MSDFRNRTNPLQCFLCKHHATHWVHVGGDRYALCHTHQRDYANGGRKIEPLVYVPDTEAFFDE